MYNKCVKKSQCNLKHFVWLYNNTPDVHYHGRHKGSSFKVATEDDVTGLDRCLDNSVLKHMGSESLFEFSIFASRIKSINLFCFENTSLFYSWEEIVCCCECIFIIYPFCSRSGSNSFDSQCMSVWEWDTGYVFEWTEYSLPDCSGNGMSKRSDGNDMISCAFCGICTCNGWRGTCPLFMTDWFWFCVKPEMWCITRFRTFSLIPCEEPRYLATSLAHSAYPKLYLAATVGSAAMADVICRLCIERRYLTVISKMSAFSNFE